MFIMIRTVHFFLLVLISTTGFTLTTALATPLTNDLSVAQVKTYQPGQKTPSQADSNQALSRDVQRFLKSILERSSLEEITSKYKKSRFSKLEKKQIETQATADPGEHVSIVRGGRLYDNWFTAIREPPPGETHPSYPIDGAQGGDPKRTWRCVECHGWDYAGRDGAYGEGPHFTGIIGVQGMVGEPVERIIAILKDKTHRYDGLMAEQDFQDLGIFITKGQVDMDRYINRATAKARGNPIRRRDYFNSICANCHGRFGARLRTMLALGDVARDNPWEVLHKILSGHPGEKMPPLWVFERQDVVDILAYTQTLPDRDVAASIAKGGRLYEDWRKEINNHRGLFFHREHRVNDRHPTYPINAAYATYPETNWRCKECHGWDYKGRDGVYGRGSHFTGIKGVRGMEGKAPEDIIAILKDSKHGYGGVLSESELLDLAIFVSMGQVDMDLYINPTSRKALGTLHDKQPIYDTICTGCHGLDGTLIATMRPLGRQARRNPWRALHIIMNGHADEQMPALRVLGIKPMSDILTYLQTLPDSRFE